MENRIIFKVRGLKKTALFIERGLFKIGAKPAPRDFSQSSLFIYAFLTLVACSPLGP